jgi:hypothetical protein
LGSNFKRLQKSLGPVESLKISHGEAKLVMYESALRSLVFVSCEVPIASDHTAEISRTIV